VKAAARLVLIAAFLAATSHAHADPPRAPATPPNAPTPATAPTTVPGDMSFDLMPEKPKLTAAEEAERARHALEIERKVRLRRKLLVTHQGFGFATLGLLAVTMVLGTLNYVDKYGGGNDDGTYYNLHTGFAITTSLSFAATGGLALFAPNPYPKPIKLDAALAHKVLMILATAGFVTQLVMGPIIAAREGHVDQKALALSHLVVGYATWGFMAGGTLAFVFK
jgi:hypothetical protein